MLRLARNCLVVLVGPSASGKSTWADEWFPPDRIVSADRLRALVGESEHDQRAGTDAFAVLDLVLERRLRRGLPTVVDTLALAPGGGEGGPATLSVSLSARMFTTAPPDGVADVAPVPVPATQASTDATTTTTTTTTTEPTS